jgi:anti-sigma regulatory factor (Ser/Thr protein kinase)
VSALRDVLVERLPGDTTAPGAARRMVVDALRGSSHEDQLEVVELLVSEVVTNAVLHAGTQLEVACRIGDDCLRVSVRDWSSVMPTNRNYDEEALTGRGLDLVEALAHACGVERLEDGKVVWFEVGAQVGEEEVTGGDVPPLETFRVRLLGLPTELVLSALQYSDAMLRELAFLMLSDDGPGLGGTEGWQAPQIDVGPILQAAEAAVAEGRSAIDLEVDLPVGSAEAALERMALVALGDGLARRGLLLSRPAEPQIGVCRRWLFGQVARQAAGEEPFPWPGLGDLEVEEREADPAPGDVGGG